MRIHDFAKELGKEAGKTVTGVEIIKLLSKKQDGLKLTSDIDEEMMEYVRVRIVGKSAEKPKTEKKTAAKKSAEKKPAEKKTAEKKPAEKKPAEKKAAEKKSVEKTEDTKKTTATETKKKKTAEDKIKEEAKRRYAQMKKTEAKKKEEEQRKAEEAARAEETRKAENARRAEEAIRKAEEAVRAEEAARAAKEEAERVEAEKAKEAAEKAKAEAEKAKAEAEKAKAEAEKSKAEAEKTKNVSEKKSDERRKPAAERRSTDRTARTDKTRGDRTARTDKSRADAKSTDGRHTGKPDAKKRGTAEAADDSTSKKSSSRKKNDKNRDREREARGEERDRRDGKNHGRGKKTVDIYAEQEAYEEHRRKKQAQKKQEEETIKSVVLPESLTLSELADKLKQPVNGMIKKLFLEGKMYTVNTELTYEEAEEIALEYNCIAEQEVKVDIVEEALKDIEDPEDSLVARPPVVCVMGHVDHGKTSLLDAIRKTSVTEGEAGGITQHIGAYTVKIDGRKITFLDTPGHEAFTAMRLRGAQATDVAILVVAADDGVMPQTVEAINHAKAAGIQIIVAVNKIDKPSANIERVKQELVEYGLVAEDWGGDTIFCPVSAHTHEGLDNLLEMILLTADVLELRANPNRKARGVVIEASLDKGRGSVATLLVQKGTLKVGDYIAIGEVHGRVRAMTDDKQRQVKEATPSMPVEVIGLPSVPNSGEIFIATDSEKQARSISDAFIIRGKENLIAESKKGSMSLDDIFSKMQEGTLKELNIIIKADVQGSVEALKQSLLKLSNDEIVIKCIHSGVGAINESDVNLAAASGAIIIGFNTRPDPMAKSLADNEKVDLRLYKVIYNAIDDIELAMKGMLDPIYEEKAIGHAEVRQTYKAAAVGVIAGCFVQDGSVERGASVRLTRGKDMIWEGAIASLKRFKDDAKEVKAGYECGIVLDGTNDIAEGDLLEVYKMVEIPRS